MYVREDVFGVFYKWKNVKQLEVSIRDYYMGYRGVRKKNQSF